jgi:hypothetical protein
VSSFGTTALPPATSSSDADLARCASENVHSTVYQSIVGALDEILADDSTKQQQWGILNFDTGSDNVRISCHPTSLIYTDNWISSAIAIAILAGTVRVW